MDFNLLLIRYMIVSTERKTNMQFLYIWTFASTRLSNKRLTNLTRSKHVHTNFKDVVYCIFGDGCYFLRLLLQPWQEYGLFHCEYLTEVTQFESFKFLGSKVVMFIFYSKIATYTGRVYCPKAYEIVYDFGQAIDQADLRWPHRHILHLH